MMLAHDLNGMSNCLHLLDAIDYLDKQPVRICHRTTLSNQPLRA